MRYFLGILWTILLIVGAPMFVQAYVEDWDILGQIASKIMISVWAAWTFNILYDILNATRKED